MTRIGLVVGAAAAVLALAFQADITRVGTLLYARDLTGRVYPESGAGGRLKGDRHLSFPSKTVSASNLLHSVLDLFDIQRDSVGDSMGRIERV